MCLSSFCIFYTCFSHRYSSPTFHFAHCAPATWNYVENDLKLDSLLSSGHFKSLLMSHFSSRCPCSCAHVSSFSLIFQLLSRFLFVCHYIVVVHLTPFLMPWTFSFPSWSLPQRVLSKSKGRRKMNWSDAADICSSLLVHLDKHKQQGELCMTPVISSVTFLLNDWYKPSVPTHFDSSLTKASKPLE